MIVNKKTLSKLIKYYIRYDENYVDHHARMWVEDQITKKIYCAAWGQNFIERNVNSIDMYKYCIEISEDQAFIKRGKIFNLKYSRER